VYSSAWLKCYHPAAFTAALINAQPMGFYAPAQLVRDAGQHGVAVRPVDINASRWDCCLEPAEPPQNDAPRPAPAIRLGMRLVRGLSADKVRGILAARQDGPIRSVRRLARRPDVSRETLVRLAAADAFRSLGLDRRQALWQILALDDQTLPLFDELDVAETHAALPAVPLDEQVVHDYDATGLSLAAHPIGLVRAALREQKVGTAKEVAAARSGARVSVAGLVTHRQRPGTAQGIVFITLEDETGHANLIVRPEVWEKYRAIGRTKIALVATGRVERVGRVVHVQVSRLADLSRKIAPVTAKSRDFH
jgi:error-prone DNA polymerase